MAPAGACGLVLPASAVVLQSAGRVQFQLQLREGPVTTRIVLGFVVVGLFVVGVKLTLGR